MFNNKGKYDRFQAVNKFKDTHRNTLLNSLHFAVLHFLGCNKKVSDGITLNHLLDGKCCTERSWKLTVVFRCDFLVLVVPHHHWHRWTDDITDHLRRLTVAELLRWLNVPKRQPLWKMEMGPQLFFNASNHRRQFLAVLHIKRKRQKKRVIVAWQKNSHLIFLLDGYIFAGNLPFLLEFWGRHLLAITFLKSPTTVLQKIINFK